MTNIVFEVLCTFTITSHSVLRIRNVSTKIVEKIETHFMWNTIHAVYEIMWKNVTESNRQPIVVKYGAKSILYNNINSQLDATIIVVTYVSESWTLTMEEERALAIFERKILRKIYGPVKENELWRTRHNDELEAIIKGENIVRFIKCQRIRWLGHIERMEDTEIPKKDVRKAVSNKTKRKTKNEMAG